MENTRIYKVFSALNKTQLNRFDKFITSPYFNKNEAYTLLSRRLMEEIKRGADVATKEEYWAYAKGKEQPFSDLKYRKLCNDLLEKFEKFLVVEELSKDNLLQANLLLSSIKENKFLNLAEKHIAKSSRLIEREMDQSAEFYLQKYFYEKALYYLKTDYEKKEDITSTLSNLTYEDLYQNLDAFYVTEKLRLATQILFWSRVFKTEIKVDLGYSLDLIEKYELGNKPAVKIYYLMYLLMAEKGDDETYWELKKSATEHLENLPNSEQREVLDAMLSYCIKDGNRGGTNFYDELLSLYDWGIDSEILMMESNHLSPTTFRNYVLAGLRFGAYEKVENFINVRARLLDDRHRENALNFNMARVMFYKKEFQEVISYLNLVNYDDKWYNVGSKMLLHATYYELKEYDALESSLDAFIKFIRREKSLGTNKVNSYMNFAKYLRKMIVKPDRDLEKFSEKVKTTNTYNKKWLLEKIAEMK